MTYPQLQTCEASKPGAQGCGEPSLTRGHFENMIVGSVGRGAEWWLVRKPHGMGGGLSKGQL